MLLCLPCNARATYIVPGAVQRNCSVCEQAVWVSPSAFPLAKEMSLICVPCSFARKKGGPITVENLTPAQIAEMKEWLQTFNPSKED